ncbi:MAG TPA: hypothetical protein VHU81_00865 [Thermoanaerobaculia bacterium]|nr:hypothetical protein [Thermoanaerobaculia bacterium]
MRHPNLGRKLCVFALFFVALLAPALQATPLNVALDIQGTGLSLARGGVGLEGLGSGSRNLTVQIGGNVQAALLYWVGRDRPCPQSGGVCTIPSQPYKDQVLRFDGNLVTGTIIGTEQQPASAGGPINNIGFLADVTSIVQARGTGSQTFAVADGNVASNLFHLDGAGLLVIYTDPADPANYRLLVFDGLDFAYGADPTPGGTRVTTPVVFQFNSTAAARAAGLTIFAGDGEATRPDRIDISNEPSRVNTLDGSDGSSFDSDTYPITIPAGAASVTVQLVSEPVNQNPDSLLWILGALRLPLPATPPPLPVTGDEGCTPGYWKNHTDSWTAAGLSPSQTTVSVFSGASAFPSLGSATLLQSLQGGGGPGTLGAAKILLRAATAALLNAAHPGVDYTRTAADIVADVNAALTSNNRDTMLDLASELDADNNLGCPLS